MQRTWIESSVLVSVGYDRFEQVLEVEFKRGGVYRYFDVPESAVEGLLTQGSHGSYFATQIRDRYRSRRVA
jgi:hypothetical protein